MFIYSSRFYEYNYLMIWRHLWSHHRQTTFSIIGTIVRRTHYSKYSENWKNQCLFVFVSPNCIFSSVFVNLYFPTSFLKQFLSLVLGVVLFGFFFTSLDVLCPQKHFSNKSKLPESMSSSPLKRFFSAG